MSFVKIDFGNDRVQRLKPLGLRLPTLRGVIELNERSTFEPPHFCQAVIESRTLLQIGAFCSISGGKIGGVTMGRYCAVAPEVTIGAHEHPTDWLTCSRIPYFPVVHDWDEFCRPDNVEFISQHKHSFPNSRPTTEVGNDVWIGQGAFVRSGVKLGTGCIIGARSVVTKDVPPYAVVSGLPAKVKRLRFSEAIVERLLNLQWWQYSLYDCFDVPFERIEDAVSMLEDRIASGALQPYAPSPYTAEDLQTFCAAAAPPRERLALA